MRMLGMSPFNVKGLRVIVRIDADVPLDSNLEVDDDLRLQAAKPVIDMLVESGAEKIILIAHLDRPGGKRAADKSLKPAAIRLQEIIGRKIVFCEDCVGDYAQRVIDDADSQIIFLENLRFWSGEEENDSQFVDALWQLAPNGIFVFDAFASAAKSHASCWGLPRRFPKDRRYCGPWLEKELEAVRQILDSPLRPFTLLLGGKKVSDKIGVLTKVGPKADRVIIGGLMALPVLVADGTKLPQHLYKPEDVEIASEGLTVLKKHDVEVLLPSDFAAAKELVCYPPTQEVSVEGSIPNDVIFPDIGPQSAAHFGKAIRSSGTVVANCVMGAFEVPGFERGTNATALALAESEGDTYIGGGDTVSALRRMNVLRKMTHVSVGGGALLKALEGKNLKAIEALD